MTKIWCLIFIIALAIILTGCDDDKPVIDAQFLARNDCKFTGYAFEETKRESQNVGRMVQFKDVTRKYYVYECPPGNQKTLSEFWLKLEKVD
jgi:hypothetical protein